MKIHELVSASTESNFYTSVVWSNAAVDPTSTQPDLPILTRETYAATPFLKRLYRTHGLLTKVAYLHDRPFLIARHLDDIALDVNGPVGGRPLIALATTHESLDKSLWCYTQNILPLISDANIDVTAMLARRYEVDTLITDTDTLPKLVPALTKYYDISRIKFVSVVDTTFDLPFVQRVFPHATITLTLGLPEAGSIAASCPAQLKEGVVVFHPAAYCHIEQENDLTFTDDRLLPTPLIRYRPGITIEHQPQNCACDCMQSFVVQSVTL